VALTPRRWLIAAALGCATVLVAYWPEPPVPMFVPRRPRPSQSVVLGDAYQTAGQLAVLERRDAALASLRATRPVTGASPELRIDLALPQADRDALSRSWAALTDTWRPFATELAAVLIIATDSAHHGEDGRVHSFVNGFWHFHPAEGHENLCLSVAFVSPPELPWTAHSRSPDEVRDWLSKAMGSCAFYAIFGNPGPAVENWLRGHNDGFARSADWRTQRAPIDAPPDWSEVSDASPMAILFDLLMGGAMVGRNGYNGYALRGCASGRPDLCTVILDSVQLGYYPVFGTNFGVSQTREWVWNQTESSHFLSDAVHSVGRDRFAAFWRSNTPRDAAFQRAMGQGILTYTQSWAKSRFQRFRAGPGLPLLITLLGVALTVVFVSATAAYASRRQVR